MTGKKIRILSVIVPAYRQERTIAKDLNNILNTLDEGLGRDYDYEVICVVDGHLDRTFEQALKIKSGKLKVYEYKNKHPHPDQPRLCRKISASIQNSYG